MNRHKNSLAKTLLLARSSGFLDRPDDSLPESAQGQHSKRKVDKFEEEDDDDHALRTSMEQEEGYCVVEAPKSHPQKKGKQDLKKGDKKDEGQGSRMDEDDVEEVSFVYIFLAWDLRTL